MNVPNDARNTLLGMLLRDNLYHKCKEKFEAQNAESSCSDEEPLLDRQGHRRPTTPQQRLSKLLSKSYLPATGFVLPSCPDIIIGLSSYISNRRKISSDSSTYASLTIPHLNLRAFLFL